MDHSENSAVKNDTISWKIFQGFVGLAFALCVYKGQQKPNPVVAAAKEQSSIFDLYESAKQSAAHLFNHP